MSADRRALADRLIERADRIDEDIIERAMPREAADRAAEWSLTLRAAAAVLREDADLAAEVDRLRAGIELAEASMWVSLQHHYRQSMATPPETSLGCEGSMRSLREFAHLTGRRPDPRAVVEIGNEHLWGLVYGEPLDAAPENGGTK